MAERTLDAVLALHATAMFLICERSSRVLYTNEAGRAILDWMGSEALLRSVRERGPGLRVTPVRERGVPPCSLVLVAANGNQPVEDAVVRCAVEWGLTRRQREVLRCIAVGDANKTIAAELGISLRTVELHVSGVLRKAEVESRAQLIAALWR